MLHTIYRDTLASLQSFQYGDAALGQRDIIVTALDTINDPEIQRNTGLDIRDLIGMMSPGKGATRKADGTHFDFILDVEDSQRSWNKPPDRYLALGEQYSKLLPAPRKLALDVNIIDDIHKQEKRDFATTRSVGLETLELLHYARSAAPRVILYCEYTLSPIDTGESPYPPFCLLANASASAGNWQERPGGYDVDAPGMFYLCGQDVDHQIAIGTAALPVNDLGETLLPCGKHHLDIHDDLMEMAADIPEIHLLSLSGMLEQIQVHHARILMQYNASSPCLLSFDEFPTRIRLDGKRWNGPVLEGPAPGRFVYRAGAIPP